MPRPSRVSVTTALAIFDNQAHVLPKLGKLPFENIVPQRRSDGKTALMVLKDGPAVDPFSQVYMYVGTRSATGTVIDRNGLDNGKLYVLKLTGASGPSRRPTPRFVVGCRVGGDRIAGASSDTS